MGGQVSVETEDEIAEKLSQIKIQKEQETPIPKSKQRYLQSGREATATVSSQEVQSYKVASLFPLDKWKTYNGKTPDPKSPHDLPEIPIKLTDKQKQLIRSSWEIFYQEGEDTDKLADLGAKVFSHIFDLSPKIKGLFPYKDAYGKELEQDKTFRGHGRKFMATIAMAVRNIDDLDQKVAPAFVNLGQRHKEIKGLHDKESGNNYFGVFTGSMLYGLDDRLDSAGDKFPKETREAWCRFLDYLVQHVQFGYNSSE